MAANNVLANLIRAFVTKSPELEERATGKAHDAGKDDGRSHSGPISLLGILLRTGAELTARDSEQINRIQSGQATSDELVSIVDGGIATSSSSKEFASDRLSSGRYSD